MAQLQLVFPFPVSTAGADVYRLSVAGLTEVNEVAFLDFLALPKRCGLSIDDVLGKPFGLVVLNGRLVDLVTGDGFEGERGVLPPSATAILTEEYIA